MLLLRLPVLIQFLIYFKSLIFLLLPEVIQFQHAARSHCVNTTLLTLHVGFNLVDRVLCVFYKNHILLALLFVQTLDKQQVGMVLQHNQLAVVNFN